MPTIAKTKKVKKERKAKKPRKKSPLDHFADLSWADLEDWAGSKIVSRGKNYQREGAVRDLPLTSLIRWKASRSEAEKIAWALW
jgi:uncharacterized Zn finger protein